MLENNVDTNLSLSLLCYGGIATPVMLSFLCTVPGRVRVAVRLRPRNAEEMMADADFADCVELQPEVHSFYFINTYLWISGFALIFL